MSGRGPSLGARHDGAAGVTRFRVWAPRAEAVELLLLDADGEVARALPMAAEALAPAGPGSRPGSRPGPGPAPTGPGPDPERDGYFSAATDAAPPGTLYRYRLHRDDDVVERPDPASRHQPRGVHGPSRVVEPGRS